MSALSLSWNFVFSSLHNGYRFGYSSALAFLIAAFFFWAVASSAKHLWNYSKTLLLLLLLLHLILVSWTCQYGLALVYLTFDITSILIPLLHQFSCRVCHLCTSRRILSSLLSCWICWTQLFFRRHGFFTTCFLKIKKNKMKKSSHLNRIVLSSF